MALIKDGRVADDPWTHLDDEAPAPSDGDIIVSLARWRAEADALRARVGRLGVRLAPGEAPEAIAADIGAFHVIALEFPAFRDGRAYSYARLLRERHGYTEELRAVGDILRDQMFFMARCGFNAFESDEDGADEAWCAAQREYSVVYQPASDARRPVLALRHGQTSAA